MNSLDELFGHEKEKKQYNNIMIIDMSNLIHATFHSSDVRFDQSTDGFGDKIKLWRYYLLNSILSLKNKIQPDEIILAIDSRSWRKDVFKYYKANRILAREKQKDFDYEEFIKVSNEFIAEITEVMPYKVIKIDNAEADDVIAVLVDYLSKQNKNVTIVSRDKDFFQLLRTPNVKLLDPIDKEYKSIECPYEYLMEHILRGDTSDGIPNLLSQDNIFLVSGKRQKSITKKVLADMNDVGLKQYAIDNDLIDNYNRNKNLVELSKDEIPETIWNDVIYEYNKQCPIGDYIKITQFIGKHKIRSLKDKIGQFLF